MPQCDHRRPLFTLIFITILLPPLRVPHLRSSWKGAGRLIAPATDIPPKRGMGSIMVDCTASTAPMQKGFFPDNAASTAPAGERR